MGAFTNTFAITTPVGGDSASQLDLFIRANTKAALEERYELEHVSLVTGVNDDTDPGAQGRHIPGKVSCLFWGTKAQLDALTNVGVGCIGYATDLNNLYRSSASGWQIFALTSDTILPDNITLEVLAGGSGNVLGMKHDNQQWTTTYELTDGATINTDCDNSNSFKVTLEGNRTLADPTNMKEGATYVWKIVQDATGSRTLTFGSAFKFPGGLAPVLSTGANAIDMIVGLCTGTELLCTPAYDFS